MRLINRAAGGPPTWPPVSAGTPLQTWGITAGMRSLPHENSSGGPRHWIARPDADMSQDHELTLRATDAARGDAA